MTSPPRHVALCPFPFASHSAQMLLLGRKIAATSAASIHLTLFTTASAATALNTISSSESTTIRICHVGDGAAPEKGIEGLVTAVGEGLGKAVEEAEEEIGVKLTFVVADAMMTFVCRVVAEERGIKWVAMWTPSAGALAAHMNTDLLRKSIAKGGKEAHKEDRVDQYIPGYPSIPVSDLPYEVLAVDDPVARILHIMSHHLQEAEAIIVNSLQQVEPAATNILNFAYPNKFHCAGPFALTMPIAPHTVESDPYECLHWLDAQKPSSVVYISFGSGHHPPLNEFALLAEALETASVPYLWSLSDKFRSYIPEKTTSLGKLVPWAPQMAVLGHIAVGAQLTHGGWNSVLEGIVSGVPMICRISRSVADHAFNGRMVVDPKLWGIGVEVEGGRLTKAETMAALDKVMVGEESKRIRKNIAELKRLAEEDVAIPGGSSAQSLSKIISIITS